MHVDKTSMLEDEAMKLLVDELYANRMRSTCTSTELNEKYVSYGGELACKLVFTKLGDDIVVLCIEGCASIVRFREFVGNIVKVVKVDTVDEEKEDVLVRKITNEAHGIPFNRKRYDQSDFTHAKTKQQTSATLLRFISKLISNGEITKASLSLSQSIQSLNTNRCSQTILGLSVKLHHKFGSSELIQYDWVVSIEIEEKYHFIVKGKGSFYIAQYPVSWTAQRALHFLPSLTDLYIPTPTREAFYPCSNYPPRLNHSHFHHCL